MSAAVQYIVDKNGHKTSVVVPIQEWESLNRDHLKQKNKLQVLTGIQKGMKEVKEAHKTGRKLQTLKDFINEESNS